MDPLRVRPSDFANAAAVLQDACCRQVSLMQCIDQLAIQHGWSQDYARAICLRHLALGRYLESGSRPGVVAPLLLLAAAVTPLTVSEGFDHALLESVARACAAHVPSANGAAA